MVMLLCCSALALVPFTRATDPLPASVTLDDDLRSGLALSLALSLSSAPALPLLWLTQAGGRVHLLLLPSLPREPLLPLSPAAAAAATGS